MQSHIKGKTKGLLIFALAIGFAYAMEPIKEPEIKKINKRAAIEQTLEKRAVRARHFHEKAEKLAQESIEGSTKIQANTAYIPPPPGGQPNYFGPEGNYANSPFVQLSGGHVVANTGIRKFVNGFAGLGVQNKNDLNNYIPVAVPDTTTYPGCDYYEIAVVEYEQKLHSDLGTTRLRGFVQLNTVPPPAIPSAAAHYLGPYIITTKGRPVRVKLVNQLPTGASGQLFLPVDTTIMGAGMGYLGSPFMYTQNRTVIHLHGGDSPWISDGTPHQWITPATEPTPYAQGVSKQNVPDMPNPGPGAVTLYFPNEQSARMLWMHDHSYGITRLNVYSGMVSAYLLTDTTEESLIADKTLPSDSGNYHNGIPLLIQDKTFVPLQAQLLAQDPTWNYRTSSGSLWFPHVYMPNQNPNDNSGANDFGRWDYGPWVWPPFNAGAGLVRGPILDPNGSGNLVPGTPNPSLVAEAFMDTPVVNGTPYPYMDIERRAYRFRVLNASNDRSLNLQLYQAEPVSVSITNGGSGYTIAPEVIFSGGGASTQASATASILNGRVIAISISSYGSGYSYAPTITFKNKSNDKGTGATAVSSINSEVKMIAACPDPSLPSWYPTMDGRPGGVPDPKLAGPSMIQIGTEAGFLPNPVVLPNTPIGYNYNRRDITVLNVQEKTLFLSAGERADVIIDFSQVPSSVNYVILYNDAPAPVPGFDPRYDYYSNNPDFSTMGGASSTIVGYGPNTRTIMQFRLKGPVKASYDLAKLQTKLPIAYVNSQPPPIVPQTTYPLAYHADSDTYARIEDTSINFKPYGQNTPVTMNLVSKAIVEAFETDYGRMNATLGNELPFTNDGIQTTVPLGYRDPPTEFLAKDEIQFWKVTHNGVDTHPVHFHLYNVQLINRVGWDGAIKPPEPNELGWKEIVNMNPLEDIIVAAKPKSPNVPFNFPSSIRYLDPTSPPNATWSSFDPATGAATTITNVFTDFGEEYVVHCHMLDHEENDFMRPMCFNLLPQAPTKIVASPGPGAGQITINFIPPEASGRGGPISSYVVSTNTGSEVGTGTSNPIIIDGLTSGESYIFTVKAANAKGFSQDSVWSNSATAP